MPGQRTIGYHFTLQSPWAYIGHATLRAIAERHSALIDYRPMSLGEVFPESGGLPLAKRHPSRQAYRKLELQRWRVRRSLDFNLFPRFWPLDIAQADRTVVALAGSGADPEAFVARAFAGIWEREEDLADPATISRLLTETGYAAGSVTAASASPAAAERYAANASEALAAGVFGSPTYALDGELFWGQDRLDFLDEALASGRPPFRA